MSIGERRVKYEQRWVSKLTGSGGSDTNVKGKRKGIFGAEKGKRSTGGDFVATSKSSKGGGKS
eukprot:2155509-Karenia_brevis.AAC.1